MASPTGVGWSCGERQRSEESTGSRPSGRATPESTRPDGRFPSPHAHTVEDSRSGERKNPALGAEARELIALRHAELVAQLRAVMAELQVEEQHRKGIGKLFRAPAKRRESRTRTEQLQRRREELKAVIRELAQFLMEADGPVRASAPTGETATAPTPPSAPYADLTLAQLRHQSIEQSERLRAVDAEIRRRQRERHTAGPNRDHDDVALTNLHFERMQINERIGQLADAMLQTEDDEVAAIMPQPSSFEEDAAAAAAAAVQAASPRASTPDANTATPRTTSTLERVSREPTQASEASGEANASAEEAESRSPSRSVWDRVSGTLASTAADTWHTTASALGATFTRSESEEGRRRTRSLSPPPRRYRRNPDEHGADGDSDDETNPPSSAEQPPPRLPRQQRHQWQARERAQLFDRRDRATMPPLPPPQANATAAPLPRRYTDAQVRRRVEEAKLRLAQRGDKLNALHSSAEEMEEEAHEFERLTAALASRYRRRSAAPWESMF